MKFKEYLGQYAAIPWVHAAAFTILLTLVSIWLVLAIDYMEIASVNAWLSASFVFVGSSIFWLASVYAKRTSK